MCSVDFYINFPAIRKLALTHYDADKNLTGGLYLQFLDRWAAQHDCVRIGVDSLRGSEEVYLLLKLKGIAMCIVNY